jgi:hypothetical protein
VNSYFPIDLDIRSRTFLTTELDEDEWSASRCGRFNFGAHRREAGRVPEILARRWRREKILKVAVFSFVESCVVVTNLVLLKVHATFILRVLHIVVLAESDRKGLEVTNVKFLRYIE